MDQFYLFKNYHFATEFRGGVEIFVCLFVCFLLLRLVKFFFFFLSFFFFFFFFLASTAGEVFFFLSKKKKNFHAPAPSISNGAPL